MQLTSLPVLQWLEGVATDRQVEWGGWRRRNVPCQCPHRHSAQKGPPTACVLSHRSFCCFWQVQPSTTSAARGARWQCIPAHGTEWWRCGLFSNPPSPLQLTRPCSSSNIDSNSSPADTQTGGPRGIALAHPPDFSRHAKTAARARHRTLPSAGPGGPGP